MIEKNVESSKDQSYKLGYIIFVMIFAGIGGALYGYDIGVINGVLLFITKDIPMDDIQMGMIVGAILIPSAAAIIITGKLADWFGRKKMLIISAIVFLISVWMLVEAQTYHMVLYSRWLQGLAVGVITIVVPLYLAETIPSHLRGRGVGIFQLFLTAGILLGTLVNYLLAGTQDWRLMFGTAAIPAAVLLVGAFFLPNSPRWLLLKGKKDKALEVLSLMNPLSIARQECEHISSVINADNNKIGKSWNQFFIALTRREFLVPFLIVIAVAILNQTTGINSILQYAAVIMENSGAQKGTSALLGANIITGFNFLITIIALCLVDKLGRKVLLGCGTALIVISLIYSGFVYLLVPAGSLKVTLVTIGLIGYIVGFGFGPGVCVWLVLSELLPAQIRSLGMGIGLCLNSLISGIMATFFLLIAKHIGYSGLFWVCAWFTFIYLILAVFIIPETKNKSLEDIEEYFAPR